MGKGSKRIAAQVSDVIVSETWKGAFGEYHNPNFPKEEKSVYKGFLKTYEEMNVGIKVQPLSPIIIIDGA
jgi:hypothetical protein